jgi:hypothetical protein
MKGLYMLMRAGMKEYKVLCWVAFEIAILNDRYCNWFPARTILMYDLVAQLLIGSAYGWRCKHPCMSLVRLPPIHA